MNFLQRLFSRPEQRAAIPWSLSWLTGRSGYSAGLSSQKFGAYVDEAVDGNAVVGACMAHLAEAFSSVRFHLEEADEEINADEVPSNLLPVQTLLTRPNPDQAWSEFAAQFIYQKYPAGLAYLRHIKSQPRNGVLGDYALPARPELHLICPEYMKPRFLSGVLVGWDYQNGTEKAIYTRDDVLAVRFANSRDAWSGRSPLKPIEKQIDGYNAADDWTAGFFRNGAIMPFIVKVKGLGALTPAKRDEMLHDYQQKMTGKMNAGLPAFIPEESMEIIPAPTHSKFDWTGIQGVQNRMICGALMVPSVLVGDPESKTYANYSEAWKAFYDTTIIPQAKHLAGELNHWLMPRYEPSGKVSICCAVDHIEALSESETAKYERAKMADGIATIDEQRAIIGLEPLPNGEGAKLKAPPSFGGFGDEEQDPEADARYRPEGEQRDPFAPWRRER